MEFKRANSIYKRWYRDISMEILILKMSENEDWLFIKMREYLKTYAEKLVSKTKYFQYGFTGSMLKYGDIVTPRTIFRLIEIEGNKIITTLINLESKLDNLYDCYQRGSEKYRKEVEQKWEKVKLC